MAGMCHHGWGRQGSFEEDGRNGVNPRDIHVCQNPIPFFQTLPFSLLRVIPTILYIYHRSAETYRSASGLDRGKKKIYLITSDKHPDQSPTLRQHAPHWDGGIDIYVGG